MRKHPRSEEQAVAIQQTSILFKKYILPNRINGGGSVQ